MKKMGGGEKGDVRSYYKVTTEKTKRKDRKKTKRERISRKRRGIEIKQKEGRKRMGRKGINEKQQRVEEGSEWNRRGRK